MKTHKTTAYATEIYGMKASAGGMKADYTVVSLSATTSKTDIVGTSSSLTGVKVDSTGLKLDITAAKIANSPIEIKEHGLDLLFGALHNVTAGLVKVG